MKMFAERVRHSMDRLRWAGMKGQWAHSAEKMPESAFDFRVKPVGQMDEAIETGLAPFLRSLEKARIDRVSFGRSQADSVDGGEAVALLRARAQHGAEPLEARATIASFMQEISAKAADAAPAETVLCDALATLSQNARTGRWELRALPAQKEKILAVLGGAEGVVEALRLAALRIEASGVVEKRALEMKSLLQWREKEGAPDNFWGGVGNTVNKQTMRLR